MSDAWPMVAGIGAGVAAAAAVGQMIVAAVALGGQDANAREVDELKRKLERMQRQLAEKGYIDEDTNRARQSLERKIKEEVIDKDSNNDDDDDDGNDIAKRKARQGQQKQKDWFTKTMEERGRRELPW